MGGWSGQGKDTIIWDGTIKAYNFIGDGSQLTGVGVSGLTDKSVLFASAAGEIAESTNFLYDSSANLLTTGDILVKKTTTAELQLTNSTTGSTANDGFSFRIDTNGVAELRNRENTMMRFITNNTVHQTLDTDGTFSGVRSEWSSTSAAVLQVQRLTTSTALATSTGRFLMRNLSAEILDGGGPTFQFRIQDTTGADTIAAFGAVRDGAHNSGALIFNYYSTGTEYEGFRVSSAGKLGVGTTTPSEKLSVTGNASISGTITGATLTDGTFSVTAGAITGASGSNSMWTNDEGYITGVDWDEIGGDQADINVGSFTNDVGYQTTDWTNTSANFKTTGTLTANAIMYVTGAKVGLGTDAPASILHTKATSGTNIITIETTDTASYSGLKPTSNGGNMWILSRGTTAGSTLFGYALADTSNIYAVGQALLIGTYNDDAFILGQNNTEVMRISTDAYVGVGATAPDTLFEIQTGSTIGKQAMTIDQDDADQAFIDFQGTYDNTDPPSSGNLTTFNSGGSSSAHDVVGPKSGAPGWVHHGMILVEINGTKYWLAAYEYNA